MLLEPAKIKSQQLACIYEDICNFECNSLLVPRSFLIKRFMCLNELNIKLRSLPSIHWPKDRARSEPVYSGLVLARIESQLYCSRINLDESILIRHHVSRRKKSGSCTDMMMLFYIPFVNIIKLVKKISNF